jgi:hypothetical protein
MVFYNHEELASGVPLSSNFGKDICVIVLKNNISINMTISVEKIMLNQ